MRVFLLTVLTAAGLSPVGLRAQSIEIGIGGAHLNTAGTLAHVRNVRDGVEVDERARISPGWSVLAEARSSISPWFSVSLGGLRTIGSTLDVYRAESSCAPPCNQRATRPTALGDASLSVFGISGALELPGSTITPGLKLGLNARRYGIAVDELPEQFASAFKQSDWALGWNYGATLRLTAGKWSGTASFTRFISTFASDLPSSARLDQQDTSVSLQFGRVIR